MPQPKILGPTKIKAFDRGNWRLKNLHLWMNGSHPQNFSRPNSRPFSFRPKKNVPGLFHGTLNFVCFFKFFHGTCQFFMGPACVVQVVVCLLATLNLIPSLPWLFWRSNLISSAKKAVRRIVYISSLYGNQLRSADCQSSFFSHLGQ